MSEIPKKKRRSDLANEQQERGYYYDDAHGYEVYDPEKDDLEDLAGRPLDVDLDGTPPLLIETDKAEKKS